MLDNIAVRDQQQQGFKEGQFWTAILPNPLSINPTTNNPLLLNFLFLNDSRMGKTSERIQHFINLSHSFENDPGFNGSDIIVAFNGLLKSVDVAQKYHSDRTSS
ncbi:hypothetical protein PSHT_03311 [Puccinia striiformis]|uniref:Uncharacterized protein n=1 Tax=Puccinia striiformis TaxID=27350 RepID=A0A2S4WFT6_9BASI|nr:hypothetical protein PSHT_03311 [Puccinia striiformis]